MTAKIGESFVGSFEAETLASLKKSDFLPLDVSESAHDNFVEVSEFYDCPEISLEFLVRTAAALRRPGDTNPHATIDAVDDAWHLIKVCSSGLRRVQRGIKREQAAKARLKVLGVRIDQRIPYEKGIKIITGQPRRERAEEDYLMMVECVAADSHIHRLPSGKIAQKLKREISEQITTAEADGFDVLDLLICRRRFEELKAAGFFGTKRLAVKKALTAKTTPAAATEAKRPASKKRKPAK